MSDASRPLIIVALLLLAGPAQADGIVFRQVDYSEAVAHGKYRSCSIGIDITLIDPACSTGGRSVNLDLRATIKYTYADGLKAVADVEGTSFCNTKPEFFKVPSWELRPIAGVRPEWHLDQSTREAPDQATASAILAAEDLGMTIRATRTDGASFAFDLSAMPSPMFNKTLWTAAHAGHDHCIAAMTSAK